MTRGRRAALWLAARGSTFALALLLGACATVAPPASPLPWVTGRLSLRVDASAERTAQSLSAAFELQGDSGRGELRLFSPLGTRLAVARWAPGEAVLESAGGSARFFDLDELSRRALGEALPLAALPDWLAGRPWPAAPHAAQADGFAQLGWEVALSRRTEGWIEARRLAAPAVLLRAKLDMEP